MYPIMINGKKLSDGKISTFSKTRSSTKRKKNKSFLDYQLQFIKDYHFLILNEEGLNQIFIDEMY